MEPRPDDAREVAGEIMQQIYAEVRDLAQRSLARERPDHTLQATALANEVYLRLAQQHKVEFASRAEALAAVAHLIRNILVDHARARGRLKRGGATYRVLLTEDAALSEGPDVELLALHDALRVLASEHSREARVVELRFFAGLTITEIAGVLGVTTRTVDELWRRGRDRLRRELDPGETL